MVQGSKQDKVRKGQNRPCLPLPQVDPGHAKVSKRREEDTERRQWVKTG